MANRGCLFLPAALLGGGSPKQIGVHHKIPPIPRSVATTDRPALTEVRRAATRIITLTQKEGGPAADNVAREVMAVVDKVFELAERLADARLFLTEHSTEALARKSAELETMELGADAVELRALKSQRKALDQRRARVAEIEAQVTTMSGRIATAAEEVAAFEAKVQADLASDDLLHELRAYQTSAEAAAEAFLAAKAEIDAL